MADTSDGDLADALLQFTNYVINERIRCYNEGVDAERERCAMIVQMAGYDLLASKIRRADNE